jgi:hypothetical protein
VSAEPPQAVAGLREIFPNHFPPRGEELRPFYTTGLIVLDTNALLDAYRFNAPARKEFLDTLRLLGGRLWIPHRVAYEFLESRSAVIYDRVSNEQKLAKDLGDLFRRIDELIRTFLKDRGVVRPESDQLAKFASEAHANILVHLKQSHSLDIDADKALIDDPILLELDQVIAGKIGADLDHEHTAAAQKEAQRRIKDKVPPGYMDADTKDLPKAIGDYLLWEQTLLEAKKRGLPVLIVSNDQKEDWVRKDKQKRRIGPRPELVQELYDRTGQRFHLVTVQTFLIHAKDYLEAEVSDSTVEQAERIDNPTWPMPANQTSDLSQAAMRRILQNSSLSPMEKNLAAVSPIPSLQHPNLAPIQNILQHKAGERGVSWLEAAMLAAAVWGGNIGDHLEGPRQTPQLGGGHAHLRRPTPRRQWLIPSLHADA